LFPDEAKEDGVSSSIRVTIHQAKGREWDRVGIRLTENQIARLHSGLDRDDEEDRKLYVAFDPSAL
jgi:superfamily I DNA/RNA helicase